MKKIYLSLSTFLLCAGLLTAQTPAHRTAATTAADVLAQMPARDQALYNQLIRDLATAGEDGIEQLISQLNAPGQGSNASVEYALSGLTHFVMAKGEEEARVATAHAYIRALDKVDDREKKAFLIRQLQLVGKDESTEALAAYLHDEALSGPAARALAAIGTEKASGTLLAALKQRAGTPQTRKDIILALADVGASGAETVLRTYLGSDDAALQKEVLYALSCLGTEASLPALAEAAAKAGYTMESTGANEAYIRLIKQVAGQNPKAAEKAATDLLKKATKAGRTQTREAALQILLDVKPDNAVKQVLAALKDPSRDYRNAALRFASDGADETMYVEVLKYMIKAADETKVDILNWIGRESKRDGRQAQLRDLELRFDLPARQVLVDCLQSENPEVRQAAVWTIVKQGDKANIPVLASLLKSTDKQTVLLAEDALAAFDGDIDAAVAQALSAAPTDAGKIAGLELLALRKADANVHTVLEQIKNGSPQVGEAAYKALKDVVTAKDQTLLFGMLETAPAQAVAPLQEAVTASLSTLPAAEQVALLNRRMIQAGTDKQPLYYKVLAATGDPSVLADLTDNFRRQTGQAKTAAFEALLSWKGTETVDELFAISADPSQAAFAGQALTAYIELASAPSFTPENRVLNLRKAMDIATTAEQRKAILRKIGQAGTFQGLLYAGTFLDDAALQQEAAGAVMTIALAHPEYAGRNVRALLEKVMQVLDNPDAHYQKQAIQKYLDETPDTEGFVSLFNGKDLSGWKGLVANPLVRVKMKPAELAKAQEKADAQMRKDWKVENGLLIFDGTGYDNICTEKQYGDFELYVDWMLDPAGPEADAGIYLRGTPQVQIWDTARVNVGAQVGSGGLYNNQTNRSTPLKVADNRLGEWNSFYIKMVGDRVTVVLNGETVVDDVILENYWDRTQPIFPVEQIELQAHGSKVYYRNIYLKELPRVEPFRLSPEEEKEGFQVLFDGTHMHQWTGNTTDYTLENGCISMNPSKSFGGNLYTKKEYGDFVYRFEFCLTPAANNGVGIRTPMEGDAAYAGMEIQILDCEHPVYKNITPLQHHGSVYGIIPAQAHASKPAGEWNTEEIRAEGDHIRVTVNGVVVLDGNIREAVKNGTPDGQEHPGLFNKTGHIGFLGHGSPVKFRNIRIKELK